MSLAVGIGLGLPYFGPGAAGGFSPASLFAAGEQGVWYDPSDFINYTAVLGPELITNGDFAAGTTGWNAIGDDTISVVSGRLRLTLGPDGARGDNVTLGPYQDISGLTVGKTYRLFVGERVIGTNGAVGIRVTTVGGSSSIAQIYNFSNATNEETSFVATATSHRISMFTGYGTDGTYAEVDGISVKEIASISACTMFQDAAGVTPVGAVGQPVGLILDKSKGLVLGSELVTNGSFESDLTGWTAAASITATWVNGEAEITTAGSINASNFNWFSQSVLVTDDAKRYRVTFDATWVSGTANLQVGTGYDIRMTIAPNAGKTTYSFVTARGTVSADTEKNRIVFGGSSAGSVWRIDNVSVKEIAGNHASQATAASRPVLNVDGNGKYYLAFDGVDDSLATGTINPGSVDKAQAFAGVRKLSDAAEAVVVEFSADANSNNGTLNVFAPGGISVAKDSAYVFTSRGTTPRYVGPAAATYPAPTTNVVTGLGDISAPSNSVRVNGTVAASSALTQGTGNFLSYPLYIGRRGGTASPFNGQLYSLITRFGANLSAKQIGDTEAWVNGKTGAY